MTESKEIERNFKGVWIPREIYLCKDLDEFDIILLAEIHSLSQTDKGCIAGNDYLADFMRRGRASTPKAMRLMVQRSLAKMKELGMLRQVSFDGRVRVLETCLDRSYLIPQTYQNKSEVSNLIPQQSQLRVDSDIKTDTLINTTINPITNDIFTPKKGIEIPDDWNANEFGKYWNRFADYMHELTKKSMPQSTANELARQLIFVSKGNFETAKKIIDRAILRRHKEFYELPSDNKTQKSDDGKEKFTDDYYSKRGKRN